jgi:hypothetical protein
VLNHTAWLVSFYTMLSHCDSLACCLAHLLQAPVMLFMKGTPQAPRCGFSRKV